MSFLFNSLLFTYTHKKWPTHLNDITFLLCDLHRLWIRPEYRCYWKVIGPDTKVAVAFGLVAGRRYGTDMTVGEALKGRGEAYKTLLREATTALLNSYNSLGFPYNSVAVITYTNMALLGNSQHDVLMTAIRFIKANSGTCKFTDCK